MKIHKDDLQIFELNNGDSFQFKGDKSKTIYWFKCMDGAYAQIFSSESDMKKFKNPAFIGAAAIVKREKR